MFFSRVVAFAIALSIASAAYAQVPRNRNYPGAMQRSQSIKTVGTVVSANQNQIQLSTNTNQTIYVTLLPETEVSVTGKADQDYLKSGVCIEFVAEVDKAHTVKEKIIKLQVVSLNSGRLAGLFPPDFATPDKPTDGEKANVKPLAADPGIGDTPPGRGRKKDTNALGDLSGSKPAKSTSGTPRLPGTFTVRGTIKMCKEGKITVSAGRGPTVKAELANDTTIDVDMSDVRVAQRDDRITVNGIANQSQPNVVIAKSVKIDLANPLSGAKKRSTRSSKTPATRPAKAKKDTTDGDDLLGAGKQ